MQIEIILRILAIYHHQSARLFYIKIFMSPFFRGINDPEHPLTLEQLDVVKLEDVHVDDQDNKVNVVFTPTIPHCSMATLIGLSIRVKLLRSLPPRFKVSI